MSEESLVPPAPPKRRRYLLAGILTLIPLWITWLVVAFLFKTSEE